MEIHIDTKKENKEDLRKLIKFLNHLLGEEEYVESSAVSENKDEDMNMDMMGVLNSMNKSEEESPKQSEPQDFDMATIMAKLKSEENSETEPSKIIEY